MKTEYIILWVDDEIQKTLPYQRHVTRLLESKGIRADIRSIEAVGEENTHEKIKSVIEDPNLDLIVVDYVMEDAMNGRELIHLIRESDHVFLPVVFYSSVGVDELMRQVAESQLDGIYLADRNNIRDKISMVVESLLVKEQTSRRTRGLLMEGVSEIDVSKGVLLQHIWSDLNDSGKTELQEYFQTKTNEALGKSKAVVEAFPDVDRFIEHMSEHFVSNAYDTSIRWKILKKGMKILNLDKAKQKVFHELYEMPGEVKPLIPLRNVYAHQSRELVDSQHDEKTCIGIRRELRRQIANLEGLIAATKPPQ